jgi:hypothetical protein
MTMAEQWEAFPKISRKMWLVATMILCAIPLIYPFALPIPVSGRTEAFFAEIEKLSPGDVILWGDSAAGVGSYVGPREFWWALWDTIAERDLKVIYTCFDRGAPVCAEEAVSDNDLVGKWGYEYGTDYVIMPYTPGQEMAMASIAAENGFRNTYTVDNRGTSIDNLPLFQEVQDLGDIDLVLIFYHQTEYGPMHVRQWLIKWDIPGIVIGQFYAIGEFYGTYVKGNLDGTLAQAEFEYLTGNIGEEILRMTMRDMQALLVIAMLLIGFVVDAVRWRSAI